MPADDMSYLERYNFNYIEDEQERISRAVEWQEYLAYERYQFCDTSQSAASETQ